MLLHFQSQGEGKKLVSVTEWGTQEAALGTGMAKAALGAQWTCLLFFMGLAPGSQLRDGHQLHDLGGVPSPNPEHPTLQKDHPFVAMILGSWLWSKTMSLFCFTLERVGVTSSVERKAASLMLEHC